MSLATAKEAVITCVNRRSNRSWDKNSGTTFTAKKHRVCHKRKAIKYIQAYYKKMDTELSKKLNSSKIRSSKYVKVFKTEHLIKLFSMIYKCVVCPVLQTTTPT